MILNEAEADESSFSAAPPAEPAVESVDGPGQPSADALLEMSTVE